jgi:hypothetical protein
MKINKTFDLEDQNWFAELSGDYNPIHINENDSRKLHSGGILVHGIHTVIWALDSFFRENERNGLSSVKTKFFKPIYLGQKLSIISESIDIKKNVIKVYDKELLVSIIVESSDVKFGDNIDDSKYKFNIPKEFKYSDKHNVLPISLSEEMISSKYPFISQGVGLEIVSNLVGLSRLVGMECPGLNSLFAGFNITFNNTDVTETNKIIWSVSKFGGNHAPIDITVRSSIMKGFVQAFIRPTPIIQLPFLEVLKFTKNIINLSNTYSIVIGGSRGLGEVTSKIITSYGGNVIITYNKGKSEAIKICDDINSNSPNILAVPLYLDMENPKHLFDYVSTNGIKLDAIYYFATPKIKGFNSVELDEDLLNLYNLFYTVYFSRLLKLFNNDSDNKIKVFYPSTIFIDQQNDNLMEYILSKKNAEIYIGYQKRKLKNIDILVSRLGRLNTDQNNSVFSVETEDPLVVMNDIVLLMN